MKMNRLIVSLLGLGVSGALACGGYSTGPAPKQGPVEVKVDVDYPLVAAGKGGELVVRVRLTGEKVESGERLPMNLAVVIDRSGSMTGEKIEQAKQAAELLLRQLGEGDAFSLVSYSNDATVVVPPHVIGKNVDRDVQKIRRLEPGGGTALYDGVKRGAKQLAEFFAKERVNRVILLSDGIANVGPSSPREIAGLGRRLADEGIAVSTVGLGDDYAEDVLSALAEASDANYYYVQDVETLPEVFEKEFGELQAIVARDLEIEIQLEDGVKGVGFLGRPDGTGKVRLRSLSGGQERELLYRCRLDGDLVKKGVEQKGVAVVKVRYANELADGAVSGAAGGVAVKVSEDAAAIDAAVNRDVAVSRDLWDNNVAADAAVADADRGQVELARGKLVRQQEVLKKLAAEAPSARKGEIAAELDAVTRGIQGLDEKGDGLTKGARKVLQDRSFQRRNAKSSK